MHFKALLLAALSATALADLTPYNALKKIEKATVEFTVEIKSWDGSLTTLIQLVKKSNELHTTLKKEATAINKPNQPACSKEQEAELLVNAYKLVGKVGQAMDVTIAAKAKFSKIRGGNIMVIASIKLMRSAAAELGAAIEKNAPIRDGQKVYAAAIKKQIDDQFARCIEML